jgi:hypothetical protein
MKDYFEKRAIFNENKKTSVGLWNPCGICISIVKAD